MGLQDLRIILCPADRSQKRFVVRTKVCNLGRTKVRTTNLTPIAAIKPGFIRFVVRNLVLGFDADGRPHYKPFLGIISVLQKAFFYSASLRAREYNTRALKLAL